jgi:hypothetical protein
MGLVGKTAFGRHCPDRAGRTGHRQEHPRAIQPVAPQVLARRHADRGVKQPAEWKTLNLVARANCPKVSSEPKCVFIKAIAGCNRRFCVTRSPASGKRGSVWDAIAIQ